LFQNKNQDVFTYCIYIFIFIYIYLYNGTKWLGVWPWMEGRRLACGVHLGKLVAEVGQEGTGGHWALCSLSPLLRAGNRVEFGQFEDKGGGPGGGKAGRAPGRMEDKYSPAPNTGPSYGS
jgi:hypothetical protein